MKGILYLSYRYLARNRAKVFILLTAITLVLYLPAALRVLVEQSSRELTARAAATPLIVGPAGSPLELVLNTLYFSTQQPGPLVYSEAVNHTDTCRPPARPPL